MRKKIVAVIGPSGNKCSDEAYEFAELVGKLLTDRGHCIVCGGKDGVMEAVCKGAKQSLNSFFGSTIGVLPKSNKEDANIFIDIVVPTGIGIARNSIIINTADIVVSIAGGSGTLSELAFAWQLGKHVIAFQQFGGWSSELSGKRLDNKEREQIVGVETIEDFQKQLEIIGF